MPQDEQIEEEVVEQTPEDRQMEVIDELLRLKQLFDTGTKQPPMEGNEWSDTQKEQLAYSLYANQHATKTLDSLLELFSSMDLSKGG
jgi:hypothetical protein